MKYMTILSLLVPLTLFLSLTAAKRDTTAPTPAPTTTTPANLIHKACANSTRKSLCISVLNSEPNAKTADLKGLAFIALKTTANTAVNTSTHIKSLLNKGGIEDPDLEDGLSSCAESYLDVVDQIEDSVDALVSRNIKNVNTWVKAAIADVVTCNGSVKGLFAPEAQELAGKNCAVQELCRNALEVVRVFNHNSN